MADIYAGLAITAIIEELQSNLDSYFDYVLYQTDVDDYYFRYNGSCTCRADFDHYDENGIRWTIHAVWGCASLDSGLNFTLEDVDVRLIEYDEDGHETPHDFSFKKI